MIILTLRTDKPEAEIGLYKDQQKLGYVIWEAHRALSETIHHKLKQLLDAHNTPLNNIEGIVVYEGPGSFTGLRIGIAVANSLATSLDIPIEANNGKAWITRSIKQISLGTNHRQVVPQYGSPPHITLQKK